MAPNALHGLDVLYWQGGIQTARTWCQGDRERRPRVKRARVLTNDERYLGARVLARWGSGPLVLKIRVSLVDNELPGWHAPLKRAY